MNQTILSDKNAERFWVNVDKNGPIQKPELGPCWIWLDRIVGGGYGQFYSGIRPVSAHRLSFEMEFGPIPSGKLVLHSCDLRNCVNPAHLWIGSQSQNMLDMVSKGRSNHPKGARHRKAKLSEENVLTIRAEHLSGVTCGEISKKYGVTSSAVWQIVNGKTWKSIPPYGDTSMSLLEARSGDI